MSSDLNHADPGAIDPHVKIGAPSENKEPSGVVAESERFRHKKRPATAPSHASPPIAAMIRGSAPKATAVADTTKLVTT